MLFHHNHARENHNVRALRWDKACEEDARWSANLCNFTHQFPNDNAHSQGQNIFTVSGDVFNATAAVIDSWYKSEFAVMTEKKLWGKENPVDDSRVDHFHEVGHLTAMVWNDTEAVGCASVDCQGRMVMGDGKPTDMARFTVCNYYPAGNFGGQFGVQVLLPKDWDVSKYHWDD